MIETRRIALTVLWLIVAAPAEAQPRSLVHTVRRGDTLASIAERYYADPRRENILVAENGLTDQGGTAIMVGLRLTIPFASHHRVAGGESWAALAEHYYGDADRASVLMDANDATPGELPDPGAEILVPYPLRHVVTQGETLTRIATRYYGSRRQARQLMRLNGLRANRVPRGQLILIPLDDLVLSAEGRRAIAERAGTEEPADGEVRVAQAEVEEQLEELRGLGDAGRYVELIAFGSRLLGGGYATRNQTVTIQRALAVAYVALGRSDLAVQAFREVLDRQPDLELDAVRTSPTVMRAFREANTEAEASPVPVP